MDYLLDKVDEHKSVLNVADSVLLLIGLARLGVRWSKPTKNSFLDQLPVLFQAMDASQVPLS